jgi:hypothetical protein
MFNESGTSMGEIAWLATVGSIFLALVVSAWMIRKGKSATAAASVPFWIFLPVAIVFRVRGAEVDPMSFVIILGIACVFALVIYAHFRDATSSK